MTLTKLNFRYGKKDVKNIAGHVATRSATQVRTHAQKWFLKQVSIIRPRDARLRLSTVQIGKYRVI